MQNEFDSNGKAITEYHYRLTVKKTSELSDVMAPFQTQVLLSSLTRIAYFQTNFVAFNVFVSRATKEVN